MSLKSCSHPDLGKKALRKLKMKAVRRGVWFKALKRIDRALLDLTLGIDKEIRSPALISTLLSVVLKLEAALVGLFSSRWLEVGFGLATKLSSLAQKWGNRLARDWASDIGFARFLAIVRLNSQAASP